MTEQEKTEETLRWLNLFDILRCKVNNYAINNKTFNLGLKNEINNLRKHCKTMEKQVYSTVGEEMIKGRLK